MCVHEMKKKIMWEVFVCFLSNIEAITWQNTRCTLCIGALSHPTQSWEVIVSIWHCSHSTPPLWLRCRRALNARRASCCQNGSCAVHTCYAKTSLQFKHCLADSTTVLTTAYSKLPAFSRHKSVHSLHVPTAGKKHNTGCECLCP